MAFTEDLDTFFQDWGQAVTWGAVSGLGILDEPDGVFGAGDGIGIAGELKLTVKHEDFDGLAHGDTITVGGTSYKVLEYRRAADGAIAHVGLREA